MFSFFSVVLWIVCGAICTFVGYRLFFAILSLVPERENIQDKISYNFRFAVIIPAHNEELLIGKTIESLKEQNYSSQDFDIYVVADNCIDKTASIAKGKGVYCLERSESQKRGKGYALDWIIQKIDLEKYDACIIMDADSILSVNFMLIMNKMLSLGHKIIQGYHGVSNPNQNWLTQLSVVSGALRQRLMYVGKNRIGMSCPLLGNGMCFSTDLFVKYGWNAFSITENWEFHSFLVKEGYRVSFSKDAVVQSQMPMKLSVAKKQRLRWFQGKMDVTRRYAPKLLKEGLKTLNLVKIDAAFDLFLPSVAMLYNFNLITLILGFLLYQSSRVILLCLITLLLLQTIYVLGGFIIIRAPIRTYFTLLLAPIFLLWKLSLGVISLVNINRKEWARTSRHDSGVSFLGDKEERPQKRGNV